MSEQLINRKAANNALRDAHSDTLRKRLARVWVSIFGLSSEEQEIEEAKRAFEDKRIQLHKEKEEREEILSHIPPRKTHASPLPSPREFLDEGVVIQSEKGSSAAEEEEDPQASEKESRVSKSSEQIARIERERAISSVKERLRQRLAKASYDVKNFYKDDGAWQAVARSQWFENLTLVVISFNTCWIGLDTELNESEMLISAHPVFQVAENSFCLFFSLEWLIRYMAFKSVLPGLRDFWFVFDGTMCLFMVLETWALSAYVLAAHGSAGMGGMGNGAILRIARLLRLSRLARMAKLMRAMPELFVMLKGLLAAARSVGFTLVLLTVLIFVYSIAFTQLAAEEPLEELFPTVFETGYFLSLHGALRGPSGMLSTDVQAARISDLGKQTSWYYSLLMSGFFFVFVLLASVLLMNLLIGVLCDVVNAVSTVEREDMLVSFVGEQMEKVVSLIDEDGGGTVSRDEFDLILDCELAIEALQDVGVDVLGLIDFADFIFGSDDDQEVELTLPEFMAVVLQLRGTNNATVKDMVDLRKFLRNTITATQARLDGLEKKSSKAVQEMDKSSKLIQEIHGILKARFEGTSKPGSGVAELQLEPSKAANGVNSESDVRVGSQKLLPPLPLDAVKLAGKSALKSPGSSRGSCKDPGKHAIVIAAVPSTASRVEEEPPGGYPPAGGAPPAASIDELAICELDAPDDDAPTEDVSERQDASKKPAKRKGNSKTTAFALVADDEVDEREELKNLQLSFRQPKRPPVEVTWS
eukprot:TRINITY_DN17780_c0_g1_i1.p1 TRINITY_DN17780_c0_g1~~TRINITY_DN17780_c0_g1_i1.p1  ORF type:complete len:757 (+),score=198.51 TRINITY_DN17780_c0_g1_i1:204-2474(+)